MTTSRESADPYRTALLSIMERVKTFGGFQKPRSFYVDRDDVLRCIEEELEEADRAAT